MKAKTYRRTPAVIVEEFDPLSLIDRLRASMRSVAASISLVTSRDRDGGFYGMAVTSWSSVSMDPPSMMVAINRSASVHSVISLARCYCLNLMGEAHSEILERFSRSEMRDARFSPEFWRKGPLGLPVLRGALASQICSVEATLDYGTHTIFVGRVVEVILAQRASKDIAPLIWINGSKASLASHRAS
jgi:flavin reductase (DIM6/NTAB) family NADH-FMN oxidoreductase RutF